MKIAVMGAGGVGGYFGGKLALAGHDVTFIARGAHLRAMRENGLHIEAASGNFHLPKVQATDDPASIGSVDWVFFAVKLPDTESAAQACKPLVHGDTAVVSFQNGVQGGEVLQRVFGPQAVLAGAAYIAAVIREPGTITLTGTLQRLVFGEYDGSRSARAQAFEQACRAAGFDVELSTDIRRQIWEKFVLLGALSGATTTMRQPIGPIRDNPMTRAFLYDLMCEVVAVGRKLGINLAADYAQNRLQFADHLPADMTSSMHQDLKHGKPLEVMWLSGAVVDLGSQAGVPTPTHRAVRDILALYAEGAH